MLPEVNDARPSSLSHLVGQKAVIAQVSTALDAAFEDGSRFDHGLLVGPPGWENHSLPPSSPRRWRPISTRFSGSRSPPSAT